MQDIEDEMIKQHRLRNNDIFGGNGEREGELLLYVG